MHRLSLGVQKSLENIALSQFSTGCRNTEEALGLADQICLLRQTEYGKGRHQRGNQEPGCAFACERRDCASEETNKQIGDLRGGRSGVATRLCILSEECLRYCLTICISLMSPPVSVYDSSTNSSLEVLSCNNFKMDLLV
ncbi:unnamed protein product [Sphagnum jensenii]|uniref:Uncharacterized protein n=1 Tax=Sphagnum jensenii TaxID=128206 RepID=A0ABP1BD16_9BRYO